MKSVENFDDEDDLGPSQFGSVVRVSALGLKGHSLILVKGVDLGCRLHQLMRLSHLDVLSPPSFHSL